MSDIQQYGWSQWGNMLDPAGGWVRHADHVAALAAQATAHINALAALTQERDFLQQQVDDQATAHEAEMAEAGYRQLMERNAAVAEAREQGVSDERARIRAGVEALEWWEDEVLRAESWVSRDLVLAVIDEEDK